MTTCTRHLTLTLAPGAQCPECGMTFEQITEASSLTELLNDLQDFLGDMGQVPDPSGYWSGLCAACHMPSMGPCASDCSRTAMLDRVEEAMGRFETADDAGAPEAEPPEIVAGCQVRSVANPASRLWVKSEKRLAKIIKDGGWVYDGPRAHWDGNFAYLCGSPYCRCCQ